MPCPAPPEKCPVRGCSASVSNQFTCIIGFQTVVCSLNHRTYLCRLASGTYSWNSGSVAALRQKGLELVRRRLVPVDTWIQSFADFSLAKVFARFEQLPVLQAFSFLKAD